jgi:hypothetical protein
VALQGIEFWSSVCEEESELAIELQEAMEEGRAPASTSRYYARGALQYLVPILLQRLCEQKDCEDDGKTWQAKKNARYMYDPACDAVAENEPTCDAVAENAQKALTNVLETADTTEAKGKKTINKKETYQVQENDQAEQNKK